MEILKWWFPILEPLVSLTTSELVTFFNISSQGEFRCRFAKFIAYTWQRHHEHGSLGMLYGLKTCFTWMTCFWTAAINYLFEKIWIHLNVAFRDQHYALGNLVLYIGRRMNKIKRAWPHRTVPSDCGLSGSKTKRTHPSKCMKLKSVKHLFTLLKSV